MRYMFLQHLVPQPGRFLQQPYIACIWVTLYDTKVFQQTTIILRHELVLPATVNIIANTRSAITDPHMSQPILCFINTAPAYRSACNKQTLLISIAHVASGATRLGFWDWGLGAGVWGFWGCGWCDLSTHTYYKFTHKFLMMLFLATIWCCLPACFAWECKRMDIVIEKLGHMLVTGRLILQQPTLTL